MKNLTFIIVGSLLFGFQIHAQVTPYTPAPYVSSYVPGSAEASYNRSLVKMQLVKEYYEQIKISFARKDYDQCIYYYKQVEKTNYYYSGLYYTIGWCYYYKDNLRSAKKLWRKAAKKGSYEAEQALIKYGKKK